MTARSRSGTTSTSGTGRKRVVVVPRSVKVFGIDVAVDPFSEEIPSYNIEGGVAGTATLPGGVYGISYPDLRLIRLNVKQSADEVEATLLHEMIHMAFALSGMRELLPSVPGIDIEEAMTRALETALRDSVSVKGVFRTEKLRRVPSSSRDKRKASKREKVSKKRTVR